MNERDILNETPEVVLDYLLAAAGASHWLIIAGMSAERGFDVVLEAKWFAKRGVLEGAVSFTYVCELPILRRIELIRDLATEASEYLSAETTQSDRDKVTARRAQTVIKMSSDYINSKTPTTPPVSL